MTFVAVFAQRTVFSAHSTASATSSPAMLSTVCDVVDLLNSHQYQTSVIHATHDQVPVTSVTL